MADVIQWRKSSYSGSGSECVEVAHRADQVLVRDSKNPDGDTLTLSRNVWSTLIAHVQRS